MAHRIGLSFRLVLFVALAHFFKYIYLSVGRSFACLFIVLCNAVAYITSMLTSQTETVTAQKPDIQALVCGIVAKGLRKVQPLSRQSALVRQPLTKSEGIRCFARRVVV